MPADPHMNRLLSSLDAARELAEAGPYAPISIALDAATEQAIEAIQEVARTKAGSHGMPIVTHLPRPLLLDILKRLQAIGWRKP